MISRKEAGTSCSGEISDYHKSGAQPTAFGAVNQKDNDACNCADKQTHSGNSVSDRKS